MATDVVCLCQQYDLHQMLGEGAASVPHLNFLSPDQVTDPSEIKFAFAFKPAPDAFEAYPNLEMVCSAGAGVDGLLMHPGLSEEMLVVRMQNPEQAAMMAGFAAWYVIGHHRKMADFGCFQSQKKWMSGHGNAVPSRFPVGILGFGAMGQAVGRALRDMGYPVSAWANSAKTVDGIDVQCGEDGLKTVMATSKAVICVLPLTAETTGILNKETLAWMAEDSILIQLGRGGHLVEVDLLEALDAGRPAKAALDVFHQEPLPGSSPLWSHPNVMITPHLASDSDGLGLAQSVSRSIAAHQGGTPIPGLVDRAKGY